MSAGYICDRCGAAIFDGENSTLKIELREAQPETGDGVLSMTRGDIDLCQKCASAVDDIIKSRIITSKTFMEAWLS